MSPEEIYNLICAIVVPVPKTPPTSVSISDPGFREFEEAMQNYYDRLATLRRQLFDAVPTSMPAWVRSSAYHAWMGAVEQSEHWTTMVSKRRSSS